MPFEIMQADITTLDVDVIVNAANKSLLGGGGVDGAIHRAAGPELLEACRALGGGVPGDAKITPGFKLVARWVVYTVGPIWRGGNADEDQILTRCYRRSLDLATEISARSIAFPAISTGAYGYPHDRAARVAVKAVEDSGLDVSLVSLDARTARHLRNAVRFLGKAGAGQVHG